MRRNQRLLWVLFFLSAASTCSAVPPRSPAFVDKSSNLKKFAPYLGRYSSAWLYDGRELHGTITLTKAVAGDLIVIAMQTASESNDVEVKWIIDLETKSKRFPVKYITPTEANGTGDCVAYFKGRDLLLEKTFHECAATIQLRIAANLDPAVAPPNKTLQLTAR